jgi:predicted permease
MNGAVVDSLAPVILLIASGYLAGRLDWLGQASLKDLTNLIFLLRSPALLFRTMSQVRIEQLDFMPVAAYFLAAGSAAGAAAGAAATATLEALPLRKFFTQVVFMVRARCTLNDATATPAMNRGMPTCGLTTVHIFA